MEDFPSYFFYAHITGWSGTFKLFDMILGQADFI